MWNLKNTCKCLRDASGFTKAVLAVPDAVKNVSIWIDSEHDVFHRGVVNERTLGVNEEHVWHPDLFHQPGIKRSTFVAAGGERQSVVLPVMSEVQGHCEVLHAQTRDFTNIFDVFTIYCTYIHHINTSSVCALFKVLLCFDLCFSCKFWLNAWGFTVSLMYADRANVKSDL